MSAHTYAASCGNLGTGDKHSSKTVIKHWVVSVFELINILQTNETNTQSSHDKSHHGNASTPSTFIKYSVRTSEKILLSSLTRQIDSPKYVNALDFYKVLWTGIGTNTVLTTLTREFAPPKYAIPLDF